jgi:hypothetical protein
VEGEERAAADPVSEALIAQLLLAPARVGFYRAVELLERSTPTGRARGRARPRAQGGRPLSPRPVAHLRVQRRARHRAPRAASRRGGRRRRREPVYEITSTFLGLTGTVSPLPTYFAEEVLTRTTTARAAGVPRPLPPPHPVALLPRAHPVLLRHDYLSTAATRGRAARSPSPASTPSTAARRWWTCPCGGCSASRPCSRPARAPRGPRRRGERHHEPGPRGRGGERRAVRRPVGDHRRAAALRLGVANCTWAKTPPSGARSSTAGGSSASRSGPAPQGLPAAFCPGQDGLDADARGGDLLRARPAGVRRRAHPRAGRDPLDAALVAPR